MLSRTIIAVGFVVILGRFTGAESLETQSNPVANGAINVATDDADRSDWEGIPWYEFDDDFEEFYSPTISVATFKRPMTFIQMSSEEYSLTNSVKSLRSPATSMRMDISTHLISTHYRPMSHKC